MGERGGGVVARGIMTGGVVLKVTSEGASPKLLAEGGRPRVDRAGKVQTWSPYTCKNYKAGNTVCYANKSRLLMPNGCIVLNL